VVVNPARLWLDSAHALRRKGARRGWARLLTGMTADLR
jgi:hypothetical protein